MHICILLNWDIIFLKSQHSQYHNIYSNSKFSHNKFIIIGFDILVGSFLCCRLSNLLMAWNIRLCKHSKRTILGSRLAASKFEIFTKYVHLIKKLLHHWSCTTENGHWKQRNQCQKDGCQNADDNRRSVHFLFYKMYFRWFLNDFVGNISVRRGYL
jgi:hypothetical protein